MTEDDDKKILIESRLAFLCWNCDEVYTIFKKEVTEKKTIITCPFCGKNAVVDFRPYKTEAVTVLKSATLHTKTDSPAIEYKLPKILPTNKITK
ncbi:MAG: hypothetical protein HN392_03695 [Anaerolineae bacterium]|nr:hypothetical protein [Anaerolineae bacterium]MBT7782257.1 hypothetical protein [Anaerolineae bacterium]